MHIYLIRHAQSANNIAASPHDIVADPPLTDKGHQQAQQLATFWQSNRQPFTHIFTSPMHRALQTTRYIADAFNLTPEVWVDLHEEGGVFTFGENPEKRESFIGHPGMARALMAQEFAGFVLPEAITETGWYTHPGLEPFDQYFRRVIAITLALRLMAKDHPQRRVALVTHAGFLDGLLKSLLNQLPFNDVRNEPEPPRQVYRHHNTGITDVRMDANSDVTLYYLNRIDHLAPHLREADER